MLWFRREQIVHATWAGNPNADAMSPSAEGLNPRASFEAWKQDIRNLSRPWVMEDVQIADELAALRARIGNRPAPAACAQPAPHAQAAPPAAGRAVRRRRQRPAAAGSSASARI